MSMERIYRILRHERGRALYLLVSAIIMGACITFPTVLGTWLQWLAPLPLALWLYADAESERFSPIRTYFSGVLYFFAEYVIVYHWYISMYPLDFAGLDPVAAVGVVIIAVVGCAAVPAFWGGFVFLAFKGISRLAGERRGIIMPFVAGALWTVFEWLQTVAWTGVPWGRAALGQLGVSLPVTLMSTSLLGTYFFTFIVYTVPFSAVLGLLCIKKDVKLCRAAFSCAVMIFALNLAFGGIYVCLPERDTVKIKVAAVQPNISSRDKWNMSTYETFEINAEHTKKAAAEGAEIIVWPETTLTVYLLENERYAGLVSELARECNATLIIGCFTRSDAGEEENSLVCVYPSGEISEQKYSKRHLVPFGEYVPMRELFTFLFPPLADISMLEGDLSAGEGSQLMDLQNGLKLGGLVCFDSIYETAAQISSRDGADILAVATNDSWFGTSAAIYMHAAQSRLRAVENGRPIIRAANTGVSTVVDRYGRELDRLDAEQEGYVISEVSAGGTRTLYSILGNAIVWLSLAFLASITVIYITRQRRLKK